MKIDDDHMYHGAALIQIAEHPQFTAINSVKIKNKVEENTFQVNQTIAVHLKYASQPNGSHEEFVFTFNKRHLEMLRKLTHNSVFVGLVCVGAREICCLSLEQLEDLIQARKGKAGGPEPQYTVLVTVRKGRQFHVYMNAPGTKGSMVGDRKVARNAFPDCLFPNA